MFYGKFVGEDSTGNKYYISKKNERWVIYQDNIEASKISADWYLWMHHTVNEIPNSKKKKISLAKKTFRKSNRNIQLL